MRSGVSAAASATPIPSAQLLRPACVLYSLHGNLVRVGVSSSVSRHGWSARAACWSAAGRRAVAPTPLPEQPERRRRWLVLARSARRQGTSNTLRSSSSSSSIETPKALRRVPKQWANPEQQDPEGLAAQLARVGLTTEQLFSAKHRHRTYCDLRHHSAAAAKEALDYLLGERGLEGGAVGAAFKRAPVLLALPQRMRMLFDGLVDGFGIKPEHVLKGIRQQPKFANYERWEDYRPTAALLDELLRERGGLAELADKQPGSCLATIFVPLESVQQRLAYLRGDYEPPAEQAQQPLWRCRLALSEQQAASLVMQEPTVVRMLPESLQQKVALLHEQLGATSQQASKIVAGAPRLATQYVGERRQLLAWLVAFYGSREAALDVVLKYPQAAAQTLANVQQSVACLRQWLQAASNGRLGESELQERVRGACADAPALLGLDLTSEDMAAKLWLFTEVAGIGLATVVEKYKGQLMSSLNWILAPRLLFATSRTNQRPLVVTYLHDDGEKFCRDNSLCYEAYLRYLYETPFHETPEWRQLCDRFGRPTQPKPERGRKDRRNWERLVQRGGS